MSLAFECVEMMNIFHSYACRQHFLQCPQGLLGKHFEKLIQCDPRLRFLSKKPEIVLGSPYFGDSVSVLEDPGKSKSHDLGLKREEGSSFSELQEAASSSPSGDQTSSSKINSWEPVGGTTENFLLNVPSPSSGKIMNLQDIVCVHTMMITLLVL